MTMREKAIDAIAEAQKAYKLDNKHYFVAQDLKELAGSLSETEAARKGNTGVCPDTQRLLPGADGTQPFAQGLRAAGGKP